MCPWGIATLPANNAIIPANLPVLGYYEVFRSSLRELGTIGVIKIKTSKIFLNRQYLVEASIRDQALGNTNMPLFLIIF